MRLVDLDSKDFENHLETGTEEFARGVRFVWDVLNNQPMVEAIPVEWLRDFQHFLYEEAEKISNEKDKNPLDTIGEMWQLMSASQAIDFTINKYGVENNLDKEIYGSEYIKMWKEDVDMGDKENEID